MTLTANQLARAKRLNARNISQAEIARTLKVHVNSIRAALTPKNSGRPASCGACEPVRRPTEQMLADAAKRCNAPRSLGAIAFGDPPPGWSALDRRMGQ